MNRNQYFVLSWFFLGLMCLLIGIHSTTWQGIYASTSISSSELTVGTAYVTMKYALFSVIIYLCFPLFVLFQILAWLEPKKK